MHWNNRMIHRSDGTFAIHEVHYDDDGTVVGWTENPVTLGGFTTEGDLVISLAQVRSDVARLPCLLETDLPGGDT